MKAKKIFLPLFTDLRRFLKAIVVVFLIATLLWLIFGIYRPFEPHYHGKPLSRWANAFLADNIDGTFNSPEKEQEAQIAFEAARHIGTNALPLALEFQKAHDSDFKRKIVRFSEDLSNPDGFDIHISSEDEKHAKAIGVFTALGASAKPAIPSLIEILQGKDQLLYDSAMQSLDSIGVDSIPPLIEILTNGNRQAKLNAIQCLGYYFGRQASNAVPALSQYLDSPDTALRNEAAKSLARIHRVN
jgi:hypothetical protein